MSRGRLTVQIVCARCGNAVMRTAFEAARSANNFCSISCSAKFRGVPRATAIAGARATKALRQTTELDRFWAKIQRGAPTECWPWITPTTVREYGVTSWRGRQRLAHRIAMALTDGLWDSRLEVCHTCDNPSCCNPAHLWRGTHRDNMVDMQRKGRSTPGEDNHRSRVTNEIVRAIRKSTADYDMLAKQYGVCRGTIYSIQKRLTWKHLP
jgi:hypothetical protein